MNHTAQELRAELKYRFDERLGILCDDKLPTREQIEIANREAEEAVKQIKENEKQNCFSQKS